MSVNVKSITMVPRIFQKIEKENSETIFYVANYTLINYDDGTSLKSEPVNGNFYRRVSDEQSSEKDVINLIIFDPITFIPEKRYYKLIPPELSAAEKYIESLKEEN